MIVLLFACGTPPLVLPVTPVAAGHASAVPAWQFLGVPSADAVTALGEADHAVLCAAADGDASARLLRSGVVGWRTVAVTPAGAVIGSAAPVPYEAALGAMPAVTDAAKGWVAADLALGAACGRSIAPDVLVAIDASMNFGEVAHTLYALGVGGVDPSRVHVLVADATPDATGHARAHGAPVVLVQLHNVGWNVDGTWAPDVGLAACRLVDGGANEVVVISVLDAPWATVAGGLDALAGAGCRPALGVFADVEAPAAPLRPIAGRVELAYDAPIAVLRLASAPALWELKFLVRDPPGGALNP